MHTLEVTPPQVLALIGAGLLPDQSPPAYYRVDGHDDKHVNPRCPHLRGAPRVYAAPTWADVLAHTDDGAQRSRRAPWAECCTLTVQARIPHADAWQLQEVLDSAYPLLHAVHHPTLENIAAVNQQWLWVSVNPRRESFTGASGPLTRWVFDTLDEIAETVRRDLLDPTTDLGATYRAKPVSLGGHPAGHTEASAHRWNDVRTRLASYGVVLPDDTAWLYVRNARHHSGLGSVVNNHPVAAPERSVGLGTTMRMHGVTLTHLLAAALFDGWDGSRRTALPTARTRIEEARRWLLDGVHWVPLAPGQQPPTGFDRAQQLASDMGRCGDISDIVETLDELTAA